jgi:GR25 family glycosyltransferase involved in LPS biosynthesis
MDVYYINLDYRQDRKSEFLAECKRIGIPFSSVYRFSAIKDSDMPYLGCTKSHLAVLKRARQLRLERVMVCEDDLSYKPGATWQTIIQKVDSLKEYDVVMLASNTMKKKTGYQEGFSRILEAQTASGYIVHSRFYNQLISCLENAVQMLQRTRCADLWINDQAWKRLQPTSIWLAFEPLVAFQRTSYSDLGRCVVNYGC